MKPILLAILFLIIAINSFSQIQEDELIDYATAYINKGVIKSHYLLNYEEAIQEYNKAIEIDTNNHFIYHNRGICKSKLHRFNEAILDFNKAIVIKPDTTTIFVSKTRALMELGHFDEAITNCNLALCIDALFIDAYYIKGWTYYKKGNINEACKSLKKTDEIGDEGAEIIINQLCN